MASFTLNGKDVSFDIPDDVPLLWAIREEAGLTGTKFGCGIGLCGACTVHVDGAAERSCITPIGDIAGRSVTTIEGLSETGDHPVQRAWVELDVPQCGYCQSGQIMAAAALLEETPEPTAEDIRFGVGNICRCGTYGRIAEAVRLAARTRAAGGSR